MDFSADGSYALVSCEFSGMIVKVDIRSERVVDTLQLRSGAAPRTWKLSPDGKVFYVADMNSNGVWLVDGANLRVLRFMPTGAGAHGLYPSRDSRDLYVTNRGAGSISVISFRTRHIVKDVAHRGQPGHGQCLGRREGAVALRPLETPSVRHQHEERATSWPGSLSGAARTASASGRSPARYLAPRAHRHPALTQR